MINVYMNYLLEEGATSSRRGIYILNALDPLFIVDFQPASSVSDDIQISMYSANILFERWEISLVELVRHCVKRRVPVEVVICEELNTMLNFWGFTLLFRAG